MKCDGLAHFPNNRGSDPVLTTVQTLTGGYSPPE
jgi:hypothetical protein